MIIGADAGGISCINEAAAGLDSETRRVTTSGGQVLLDIFHAKRRLAALQPLEKQVFVIATGHDHAPKLIAMFLA